MRLDGRWRWRAIGLTCLVAACADGSSASPEVEAPCAVIQPAVPLDGVPEASGLTLSLRTPGVLWTHNDSGQPVLFAFDASGAVRGRVRIPNAAVEDWEAVTAAPCPAGTCLYIADIGDNDRVRRHVTIYRVPEPAPVEKQTDDAEIFTATYPDGPHDAEALFVAGDDLFVVTKDKTAGVYRFPNPLRAGTAMQLERVAELNIRLVTDAAAAAGGALIALRTNRDVTFFRLGDLVQGRAAVLDVPVRELGEPQGEGVALGANGTVYLSSEAGGGKRAGSLRALRCRLPE